MPKAFISYSWSSPEHQSWVIELASQLRENGVDVILDKWDLREGHDAIKFMESMVTDPEVQKVIIVSDKHYAHKADARRGGVGTESQIISAEVYQKADQNKFVAVVTELSDDGTPYLPTFYKSRIYIDLSSNDIYAPNFEQLLRWLHDKLLYVKPTLGKPPEFLSDDTVSLPTRSRARRAIELLRSGSPVAVHAVEEYLTSLGDGLESFRLTRTDNKPFDQAVLDSIEAFLPYRNEYVEVITNLSRYNVGDAPRLLQKFFERLVPYLSRPKSVNQWHTDDFDNFVFIIHELFLYTITVLLKYDRFNEVAKIFGSDFYVRENSDYSREPMQTFEILHRFMTSLDARQRELNRASLRADLLQKRSHVSGIEFRHLMQADFVLFLRAAVNVVKYKTGAQWFPESLLYTYEHHGPFEIFARAQSISYFTN